MNILIVNAILYTAENRHIKKTNTIKDTMIYDLCLGFQKSGHNIVLYAGEPYKPIKEETYPFEIIWGKCILEKIFLPNRFPFMPALYKYIKKNKEEIDLVISSEVFSMSTLIAYRCVPNKLIAWHEIAKHQNFMKKIPSKIWYSIIVKYFMKDLRVVTRSVEAREFIRHYCGKTEDTIIDHGVNLELFKFNREKDNFFLICSQLIERKRIIEMITYFNRYLYKYNKKCLLYIVGDGKLKNQIAARIKELKLQNSVKMLGHLEHWELIPLLSKAQALLVNTVKDNNMISIVEAIAVGTPIVTTDIPLNASYINEFQLGIVRKQWDERDLNSLVKNEKFYVDNCVSYREKISTIYKVEQFIKCFEYRQNI